MEPTLERGSLFSVQFQEEEVAGGRAGSIIFEQFLAFGCHSRGEELTCLKG